MLTNPKLEDAVIANPAAYRDQVTDIEVTEWDCENQICKDCGDYGYEYFGGDWFVVEADVWIEDEGITLKRSDLLALIGREWLARIEERETEAHAA